MIGLSVQLARKNFLDREHVIQRLGKARARTLARWGGMVRTIARRSIRPARKRLLEQLRLVNRNLPRAIRQPTIDRLTKLRDELRKKLASEPGKPPRARGRHLRDGIAFFADRTGVVIGPALTHGRSPAALQALEYGGQTERVDYQATGRKQRSRRIVKQVSVAARPFMGPAFTTALAAIPEKFTNMLHRG